METQQSLGSLSSLGSRRRSAASGRPSSVSDTRRPRRTPPFDSFATYLRIWDSLQTQETPLRLATVHEWTSLLDQAGLTTAWAPSTTKLRVTTVRAGFRFLGLTDAQGAPQLVLARVVAPAERRQALHELLHDAYQAIMPLMQVGTSTLPDLLQALEAQYAITGYAVHRAARFFLDAAWYAGEQLSPALAIVAERSVAAAVGRAEGVQTVARGQRLRWIGSYRAAEALERMCIPEATFDLLVRERIILFKRVGARWQGASYPMPAIEALAPVLDRFVRLSWRNYDRWWTTVSGRGLGEAPDYADTLCFFHDPEVRAEWAAESVTPVDDDWVFQRLLSDLRLSEQMTDLTGATTPAADANTVEAVEAVEETESRENTQQTEQREAPGIDWDAWVR